MSGLAGLGAAQYRLAIYIANRPLNKPYPELNSLQPLLTGELQHIVANNSNHWRKVFNVYAKFLQALDWPMLNHGSVMSWQVYRDQHLLQAHSAEALIFSAPDMTQKHIKIVAGKTHAAQLHLPSVTWLNAHFAVNVDHKLIVCPYLDYRQLSNDRIKKLTLLVRSLSS